MGGIYITEDGKESKIDPEMFILLYMGPENTSRVLDFLAESGLDKKFELVEAEIFARFDQDLAQDSHDSIKTLVLKMKDDRVLFEYKLSGKQTTLLEQITNYLYNGEEE